MAVSYPRIIAALALLLLPRLAVGQSVWQPLIIPTSEASDRIRLAQLAGDTTTLDKYLIRSPSLLLPRDTAVHEWTMHALRPDVRTVYNSRIPFGPNTGALWAQRGFNASVTSGINASIGRLRLVVAPELWLTSNQNFEFTGPMGLYVNHPVPVPRWGNGYANIWYVQPYSADVPWRNGERPLMKLWWGQSGAWYNAGPVEVGITSENMWWGPGIQNAIVMSDNAAGVPRIELRTPGPIRTRAGSFEARWFVGALEESQYFDTTKTDDRRSLAAAVVTWRPAVQPNLSLGAMRAVFATADRYRDIPFRWLDIFANTGQPSNHPVNDSSLTPGGRDQLFSLFGRWVFPSDGFEVYGEWARQELPISPHDFITDPTHTHGYTVGLQYRRPVPISDPAFRLQLEMTTLEPSADRHSRPIDVFYTSRRVIQGYTQFGKTIGAAIGPGSSSQWLAIDRVWSSGSVGLTFNRIRWDEGVRAAKGWPGYLAYCNQDVSIIPGVRAGHTLGSGYISASFQGGTRFNYHFQNLSGCFGPDKVDLHNRTLSLSFSPFHP